MSCSEGLSAAHRPTAEASPTIDGVGAAIWVGVTSVCTISRAGLAAETPHASEAVNASA